MVVDVRAGQRTAISLRQPGTRGGVMAISAARARRADPQSVVISPETLLSASRRLRDISRSLVREANDLIVDSRSLGEMIARRQRGSALARLTRLRGGRDLGQAAAPVATIRAKIADGTLPRRSAQKTWFGHGTEKMCDACQLIIHRDQIEVEADFDGAATIRLHSSCFHIWHVERSRSD